MFSYREKNTGRRKSFLAASNYVPNRMFRRMKQNQVIALRARQKFPSSFENLA